jgi:hypothetical protein
MMKGNPEVAYNLMKRHFGERKPRCKNIRDSEGKLLMEEREIRDRWKQYSEDLYSDHIPQREAFEDEQNQVEGDNRGPGILRTEFERALKDLKNGKEPGEEKISGEVIKALGEKVKDVPHGIIQDCYESGKLPEDVMRSSMVTATKRARAEICEEHRTLGLESHASKVLTRILGIRIEGKTEENLPENQLGFRKNRGTREAILCLRLLQIRENDPRKQTTVQSLRRLGEGIR